MTHDPIRAAVLSALCAARSSSDAMPGDVDDRTPLGPGGLGISSLGLLHVFVRLEDQLAIVFDDMAVANGNFATFGDLCQFVARQTAPPGRAAAPAV